MAVAMPLVFGLSWSDGIERACNFLIVSCPCALVISVPLGFFAVSYTHLGFTSVMYDGSTDPYEDNIIGTRRAYELASKYGASVEGELGLVGGSEDGLSDHGIKCTNPDLAHDFCEKTGVSALAVAIGNAHGDYPVAPELAFDILEEINHKAGKPLVLHGGSGLTDDDFRKAVSLGIDVYKRQVVSGKTSGYA